MSSVPPFDPDDPRLTAYALGEADEADRLAVEETLNASPEARAQVEQTRALARLLASEYAQENERFAAARTNVIPFPQARPFRWRPVAARLLAAAAVLALLAPVVYLGVRSTHRTAAPVAAAPPPETPATALTKEAPADEDRLAATGAVAAAPAPAPAMAAPPLAARPGSVAKAAAAAPGGDVPRRSTVRIRTADGRFFGGVILSAEGLVLSSTALPDSARRQPCTVVLADGREFPAAAELSSLGPGWCWLRIDAAELPAATPGTEPPAAGASLTVPAVDVRTGTLAFPSPRPGETSLAFDAAGELLVAEAADATPREADGAKRSIRRAAQAAPAARPFTGAEREAIRQRILKGP